jgi:predicted nucleic acid-binding protein
MIVLDASAALEVLLRAAGNRQLVTRTLSSAELLVAPHLLDLEVAHVLRRFVAGGELTAARAEQALADYDDLRIARYPHRPLLPRIWQLRENYTAYDAAYLALAEALGAPLVTCDRRLASAPGHRATVECISG